MINDTTEPRSVNLDGAAWRKSSYTQNNGNCVEISDGFPGVMPVRDSKRPEGQALIFRIDAWASFVQSVKTGGIPLSL
jgi:hypothetical protein